MVDQALAPVMADIDRQHPGLLRVAVPESPSPGPDAWLLTSGGGRTDLQLDYETTHVDAVRSMTAQVQEVAIEEAWGVTGNGAWPECPSHPERGPLDFDEHDGRVYWFCPHDGHVVSEVGRLGLPPEQEDFGFTFAVPDPLAGPRMTEEEAEDLAQEMRRNGAPDARVERFGLRHVVDFTTGENVISVEDPAGWTHLRSLLPRITRSAEEPRGPIGGIFGWAPGDDTD